MRTIIEMQTRYRDQLEQREATIEAETTRIAARWITALEELVESAFQQLEPKGEAVAYSNAFSVSSPLESIKAAASRVVDHFNLLGFSARTFLSSFGGEGGRPVFGVGVSWVAPDPQQLVPDLSKI